MTHPTPSAMLAMAAELRDGMDTGWSGDAACVSAEVAERAADMLRDAALAQPAPPTVPAEGPHPVKQIVAWLRDWGTKNGIANSWNIADRIERGEYHRSEGRDAPGTASTGPAIRTEGTKEEEV